MGGGPGKDNAGERGYGGIGVEQGGEKGEIRGCRAVGQLGLGGEDEVRGGEVVQRRGDLSDGEGWVQGHEDGAEPVEAVGDDGILHAVAHEHGDTVALFDAGVDEAARQSIAPGLKLGVGDSLALMRADHGRSVAILLDDGVEMLRYGLLKKARLFRLSARSAGYAYFSLHVVHTVREPSA